MIKLELYKPPSLDATVFRIRDERKETMNYFEIALSGREIVNCNSIKEFITLFIHKLEYAHDMIEE